MEVNAVVWYPLTTPLYTLPLTARDSVAALSFLPSLFVHVTRENVRTEKTWLPLIALLITQNVREDPSGSKIPIFLM